MAGDLAFERVSAEAAFTAMIDEGFARGRAQALINCLVQGLFERRFDARRRFKSEYSMSYERSTKYVRIASAVFMPSARTTIPGVHLEWIARTLRTSSDEIWLLPRNSCKEDWQRTICAIFLDSEERLVLAGIESFMGQMATMLARFDNQSTQEVILKLRERCILRGLIAAEPPKSD